MLVCFMPDHAASQDLMAHASLPLAHDAIHEGELPLTARCVDGQDDHDGNQSVDDAVLTKTSENARPQLAEFE